MCVVDATQSLLSSIPVRISFSCHLLFFLAVWLIFLSDDVTVEVIFFGQGPDSRTVEVNQEASASDQPPKSKL